MKMNKTQFIELINATSFDQDTKNLFITSYSLGYSQGTIDQMEKAIQIVASTKFREGQNVNI